MDDPIKFIEPPKGDNDWDKAVASIQEAALALKWPDFPSIDVAPALASMNEILRSFEWIGDGTMLDRVTEVDRMAERAEGLGMYNPHADSELGAVPGYESLELVLAMAYQHAACSKGKERHASGLPFHEQPMQRESDDLGTAAGLIYQARKKVREGSKLPTERAQIAEMVGAINYIAGWIIWTLRQDTEDKVADPVEVIKEARKKLHGLTAESKCAKTPDDL